MSMFFKIALRNLLKNKTRTFVLGGAIAGIAFLMTLLLSLVNGIQSTMIQNGTAVLTGHINIGGFYKVSPSSASPLVTDYMVYKKMVQDLVPEAVYIIDRMKAYGKIISETDSVQIPVWGIDYQQEKPILSRLELAEPSDYISTEELKSIQPAPSKGNLADIEKKGSIVVFASQARKLRVRVGDMVTVSMPTYRNMSNTMDVKVVAVLKDLGLLSQFSSFLNSPDTRDIYKIKDSVTGAIMIYLKDLKDVPKVEERLRKAFAEKNIPMMEKESIAFFMKFDRVSGESWTGQRIDITNWEDETSFLKWILQLLSALTYGLIFILLVVVVIGLMNALWMAIRERTFEIGTMRAIGVQKKQIFILFMLESTLLSLMALAIGTTMGAALSSFLDSLHIPLASDALKIFFMSNQLTFVLTFSDLWLIFILIFGFLILGSLLPTWQATRLKPVVAMGR